MQKVGTEMFTDMTSELCFFKQTPAPSVDREQEKGYIDLGDSPAAEKVLPAPPSQSTLAPLFSLPLHGLKT